MGPVNSTQAALQYGGLLSQQVSQLLRLYISAPNGAVEYELELAKMISFFTTVGANNIVVMNKFKSLLYEQMKRGSITIMDSLITSIGESHYSTENLIAMSAALASHIAIYSSLYDAEYRSVVISLLEKLYSDHQHSSLCNNLEKALSEFSVILTDSQCKS